MEVDYELFAECLKVTSKRTKILTLLKVRPMSTKEISVLLGVKRLIPTHHVLRKMYEEDLLEMAIIEGKTYWGLKEIVDEMVIE